MGPTPSRMPSFTPLPAGLSFRPSGPPNFRMGVLASTPFIGPLENNFSHIFSHPSRPPLSRSDSSCPDSAQSLSQCAPPVCPDSSQALSHAGAAQQKRGGRRFTPSRPRLNKVVSEFFFTA